MRPQRDVGKWCCGVRIQIPRPDAYALFARCRFGQMPAQIVELSTGKGLIPHAQNGHGAVIALAEKGLRLAKCAFKPRRAERIAEPSLRGVIHIGQIASHGCPFGHEQHEMFRPARQRFGKADINFTG